MLECPFWGQCTDLCETELPVYYCHIRNYLRAALKKDSTISEICNTLVLKIKQIRSRPSVPVDSSKRILKLIKTDHDKHRKLLRSKNGKGSNNFDSDLAKFREEAKICLILLPVSMKT